MYSLIESELIAVNAEAFKRITLMQEDVFLLSKKNAELYLESIRRVRRTYGHAWDIQQTLVFPFERQDTETPGGGNALRGRLGAKVVGEIEEAEMFEAWVDEAESESDSEDEAGSKEGNENPDIASTPGVMNLLENEFVERDETGIHKHQLNQAVINRWKRVVLRLQSQQDDA